MLADGQLGVVPSNRTEDEEMLNHMDIVLIADASKADVLAIIVELYVKVADLDVGLDKRAEGAVAFVFVHSVMGDCSGAGSADSLFGDGSSSSDV